MGKKDQISLANKIGVMTQFSHFTSGQVDASWINGIMRWWAYIPWDLPKPSHNEKNALFQNYVFMVTFRGGKKNGFSLFSLVVNGREMTGNVLGLEHILTRFPLFSFLHCTLFLFKMQLSFQYHWMKMAKNVRIHVYLAVSRICVSIFPRSI